MPPPNGDNDGLLSRVVRFVRNSTSGWSETDFVDPEHESGYSRQMLKEMIERKRRNDFVRKREFDMLRKLRRSGATVGHDMTARPSFFQSSMPSRPDDRASTLKKIDEIEAQMSQQWWKTKGVDSTGRAGFDTGAHVPARALLPDLEMPAESSGNPVTDLADLQSLADTVPSALPAAVAAPAPGRPQPAPDTATAAAAADDLASLMPSTSFALSKAHAMDVEELVHDPELEEAAIRFANGDATGAEVALRALLSPGSPLADNEDIWLTLFDLYRVTGQPARYEEQAMAFAGLFGRSPPQWRPLDAPSAVGAVEEASPGAQEVTGGGPGVLWSSPAVLDGGAVGRLQAATAEAPAPWRLDWSALVRIHPEAAAPLLHLFSRWCAQPVYLHFAGALALEQALADAAPSGARSVDPLWWRLRMEALRLIHRPDEFELVALDYCVTYEVSPPSWDSPVCHFRVVAGEADTGASTLMPSRFTDGGHESAGVLSTLFAATEPPVTSGAHPVAGGHGASGAPAELAGLVLGDASALFERIDERLAGMESLVISCARLVRMDFAAAGTLLNWATARSAEGRAIHLVEVNRLVAEFLHVIGVSTQARISLRQD